MASAMYDKAKENLLTGALNYDTADVRAQLVNVTGAGTLYTFSAAHDFFDDITSASRQGTAVAIANTTVASGLFDGDDTVITSVTGDTVEAIVIYNHSPATDATRQLIAYVDGVSVTPNGGNITISWDNGTNKIIKIG